MQSTGGSSSSSRPHGRCRPRQILLLGVAASLLDLGLRTRGLAPLPLPTSFAVSGPPGVRGQSPVARAAFDLGKTVSGMFGGGEDEASQFAVPKDVAALVEGLKSSTEASLNLRCSRLDVEIPPAYKLGVEGDKKKGRLLVDKINADDEEVARSDRELARVFVEMFLEIGPGLMIVFRNKALATAARATWKLETKTEGRVISFPETPKSAFAAEVGVPAKFMQKLTEGGCKCLIVVGPYMEQLRLIEEIGNQVQDQMGIILLNSRIHGKDRITEKKFPARLRASLQQTYTPSYHVRFLERKNGILFRMVGADGKAPWIVAQQKELFGGQPVTQEVLRSDQEPSAAEIRAAFQSYDSKEKDAGEQLVNFFDKDKGNTR